ncbi:hypothetical protein P872_21185 [Rhodonellum psychrophilum GCM71 = DSM 17998]|uniref:Uncharacterized protein n=1 Tax=Rhodonellum psychrophilum GCM71 = DSM 17998 TaxID=1123057 RepID=U5BS88_9BACT|nr:hypothetical protein P872_21185 [Rhodonellum psychrophilum GCM71 = DSM 17998]
MLKSKTENKGRSIWQKQAGMELVMHDRGLSLTFIFYF